MTKPAAFGLNVDPNTGGLSIAARITMVRAYRSGRSSLPHRGYSFARALATASSAAYQSPHVTNARFRSATICDATNSRNPS